jgi:hypothetical protein
MSKHRKHTPEQEDFSRLPPLYEKITTETETPEELQHRLYMDKAKFFSSVTGLLLVFLVLVSIIFWHDDPDLRKAAQVMLQTLAAGFIGYLVKR